MSKDNKKKRVPISEIQIYINDGWVPSKRYINNNLNN